MRYLPFGTYLQMALLALGILIGVGTSAALADEDAKVAIVGVIQTQLEALEAGDSAAAFEHAAPNIKAKFDNPARFLQMVKRGYGALIAPSVVEFRELDTSIETPVQEVLVVDRNGQSWAAFYRMERQDDGSWKIAGVQLFKLTGSSV